MKVCDLKFNLNRWNLRETLKVRGAWTTILIFIEVNLGSSVISFS
jgi:hypothetical protein